MLCTDRAKPPRTALLFSAGCLFNQLFQAAISCFFFSPLPRPFMRQPGLADFCYIYVTFHTLNMGRNSKPALSLLSSWLYKLTFIKIHFCIFLPLFALPVRCLLRWRPQRTPFCYILVLFLRIRHASPSLSRRLFPLADFGLLWHILPKSFPAGSAG